jgi:hypothetical protein
MLFIDKPHFEHTHPSPLDIQLNVAVLHIASRLFPCGFNVSDAAPQFYNDLKHLLDATGRMTVYAGASETTIYGDREVNYAFRAWHDWCHWRGAHDFSSDGEHAVYETQCSHLVTLYGENEMTRRWQRILYAEIIGQQAYFDRHGIFPINQRAFVQSFLSKRKLIAAE